MSVNVPRYLNQPVTIYPAVTTIDVYGNRVDQPGVGVPALGFIQQSSSAEFLDGRDTVVSQWRLYLLPGTAITAESQVGFGSQLFQVTGEPVQEWNPVNAQVDFVRCDLTVVS